MKQLRSFLSLGLFGRKPPEGWGAGKRLLFWLWNGGMLLLGALGIGCLSLLFAAVIDRGNMFLSYFQNPWIAFLNLAPVVLLTALLYFLTGRAALAYGISAVIVMGFTMGSWFKLQFRNDPLYFEELLYLREAGNMTGQYHLFFTVSMAAALALLLAGLAALLLLVRGRPGKWVRLGARRRCCCCASPWAGSSSARTSTAAPPPTTRSSTAGVKPRSTCPRASSTPSSTASPTP